MVHPRGLVHPPRLVSPDPRPGSPRLGEGEPAWWLNPLANPEARVDLGRDQHLVTGRAAQREERERLWDRWRETDENLDAYAARRSTETAVVVLEPGQ